MQIAYILWYFTNYFLHPATCYTYLANHKTHLANHYAHLKIAIHIYLICLHISQITNHFIISLYKSRNAYIACPLGNSIHYYNTYLVFASSIYMEFNDVLNYDLDIAQKLITAEAF